MSKLGKAILRTVVEEFDPRVSDKAYRRKRAERPPQGYVATEALVMGVDREETNLHFGGDGGHGEDWVFDCTIRYAVYAGDGQVHPLVVQGQILASDTPSVGHRERVAYDPTGAGEVLLLETDAERHRNRLRYLKSAIRDGAEERVSVTAVQATGRVRPTVRRAAPAGRSVTMPWARKRAAQAREQAAMRERADPGGAPEKLLTLRTRSGLEVRLPYWDVSAGVEAGTEGVLFYHPHEPALGFPVFPGPDHRRAGDPVAAARDHVVKEMARAG